MVKPSLHLVTIVKFIYNQIIKMCLLINTDQGICYYVINNYIQDVILSPNNKI